jgi:hypothetical protein
MSAQGLGRLVDLALQLEADAQRPAAELRRRDRALGRELASAGLRGDDWVEAWLEHVRPADSDGAGARSARALRGLSALLAGFGVALGSGAAAALFHYDGTHPVNVVRVIAFFVGLQLLLLAGTALLLLGGRWRRFIPGLALVQDVLSLASPGRWLRALHRLLPAAQRDAVARAGALALRQRRLYGEVERWTWLCASQLFGVSFHLAALATALGLVVFTDLAFGWSTTLTLEPRTLEQLTHALATPWARLWPDAVPTPELIAATQYFRGGPHVVRDPMASAPWWRFCAACMVVYGLLPRAALLALGRSRLRRAVRRAFVRQPAVLALRDRLEHAVVETTADAAEAPAAPHGAHARPAIAGPAPGQRCAALAWSGFPLDIEVSCRLVGLVATSQRRAGEGALADDAAAIEALRRAPPDEVVAVLVKAWEPPLLELMDFLRELRAAQGDGRVVALVPLAQAPDGTPAVPRAEALAPWRLAVEQSADPWLVLHAPERER